MWFLLIIPLVLVLFLAVIICRAVAFKPKAQPVVEKSEISFDRDKAAECLSRLIKCKTVSSRDPQLEDDTEFEKLISILPDLYPNVMQVCELTTMPDRGLLFRWRGRTDGAPSVMMAHYDVVPANEDAWSFPAFEGIIKDGYVHGRGALDTKVTFNGIMFSADRLIKEGFVPECDVYFAFSGGEEVNGQGAVHIVDHFEKNGIEPAFILDEVTVAFRRVSVVGESGGYFLCEVVTEDILEIPEETTEETTAETTPETETLEEAPYYPYLKENDVIITGGTGLYVGMTYEMN